MKDRQRAIIAGVFSLVLFVSCNKDEDPYIRLGEAGTTVVAEGTNWVGWSTFVKSNYAYSELTTTSSASWCIAKLTESNKGYLLSLSVEDNPTLKPREATISVQSVDGQTAASFLLSQKEGEPYVLFKDGENNEFVTYKACGLERTIESNADFNELSVISDQDWCTARLEKTGSAIKLKVDVAENISLDNREADISFWYGKKQVNNTSFVVTQERIRIFYRYWSNEDSYVEFDYPGLVFQLNKVAHAAVDELEIEYTLTNVGYNHNISAIFYTSESEPAIRDNTGRTYMCKIPYNGDYLATIDGTAFGMYGQGWTCTFRPNAPVQGRVLIHNFSQSATSIWMTIIVSSSDLDMVRPLEFVNVPIED
jgi:hypothetical protein